jgi:hypothetical protein
VDRGRSGVRILSVRTLTPGTERRPIPTRAEPPYPLRNRATASGAKTATIATVHSKDLPT